MYGLYAMFACSEVLLDVPKSTQISSVSSPLHVLVRLGLEIFGQAGDDRRLAGDDRKLTGDDRRQAGDDEMAGRG